MNRGKRADSPELWSVILAAGGSERLGTAKQLVPHGGRPLILAAVDAAREATPGHVVVVVGAEASKLSTLIERHDRGVRVVTNTSWREGMASSLLQGLEAVPGEADAVLFLVTDQPHVGADELQRLIDAWRERPDVPAAARYAGRIGVPAVLPRACWDQLRGLRGDTGARAILRGAAADTTVVEMPEAELDIDTPEDLKNL